MKRRRVLFIRLSQFRILLKKFLIALVFLSALLIMMLSKADNLVVKQASASISSLLNPVVKILQMPAQFTYFLYDTVRDIAFVYQENKKLKEENVELLMLKNQVRTLKIENKLLGRMLRYTPPPEATFITAKIIAEEGDAFSHSMIAYAPNTDKVKKGQVVLGSESVIGRVDEVNGNYIRILLFSDINSKIPVIVERSRARGVLSGDNTLVPKLLFTALNADIKEGDMLVTSGVAGVFPVGLPIGVVSNISQDTIEVETITDIERLEYVRIVDYDVYNGVLEMNAKYED